MIKALAEHVGPEVRSWIESNRRVEQDRRAHEAQLERDRRLHESRLVTRATILQAIIVAGVIGGGAYAAFTGQWALTEKILIGLIGGLAFGFGARR